MVPDRYFSANKYIEYIPGDLNIILSVPHGGYLKPESIPDRDAGASFKGCVVYDHKYHKYKDPKKWPVRVKCDLMTIELAISISDELAKIWDGHRPHVILNRLHRGKLDCNCCKEKGTFNHPEAAAAWEAFHGYIERAKSTMKGRGLFFDLHGHVHSENWVELGYTVQGEDLDANKFSLASTSVSSLVKCYPQKSYDLIKGPQSFGGLLAKEGYVTVPSPQHPSPGKGSYYTGGYNTEKHGSKNGGSIDGIQIESPACVRTNANLKAYSKALAKTMKEFYQLYYSDH